jgi:hypothetical protein
MTDRHGRKSEDEHLHFAAQEIVDESSGQVGVALGGDQRRGHLELGGER